MLTLSGEESYFKNLYISPEEGYSFINKMIINCRSDIIKMDNCSFYKLGTSYYLSKFFSYSVLLNGRMITVTNSIFEDCGNSKFGGGIFISSSNNNIKETKVETLVSDNTFYNCSSFYGGAIYYEVKSEPTSILFKNIEFGEKSRRNKAKFGSNLFVTSQYLDYIINKDTLPILINIPEDDNRAIGVFTYSSYMSEDDLYNLVSYVNGYANASVVYVGDEGNNTNDCKSVDTACGTIEKVIYEYRYNNNNISVIGFLTEKDVMISISLRECTISGYDETSTVCCGEYLTFYTNKNTVIKNVKFILNNTFIGYNKNSLFYCSKEELLLSSLTVTSESNELKVRYGLIYTGGGSLIVDHCTFSQFTASGDWGSGDKELIRILNNIVINGSTFDGFNNSNGDGGAIYISLNSIKYIYIESAYGEPVFKRNNAIRGGAISVYISDYYSGCPSLPFSNMIFGTGEEANTANNGKNIFIEFSMLERVATKFIFPFLEGVEEGGNLFEAYRGARNPDQTVYDLVSIINEKLATGPSELFIGTTTNTETDCSNDKDQLRNSLTEALSKVSFRTIKVKVVSNVTLGSFEIYGLGFNIEGSDSNVYIIPNDITIEENAAAGQLSFDIYTDSSFTNLKFLLNDKVSGEIINIFSGTTTLTSVSFAPESGMCVTLSPIVNIDKFGNAVFDQCSFKNIERMPKPQNFEIMSDTAAIYAYLFYYNKLIIKGCEFENCFVSNGRGGGLYVYLSSDSSLTMGESGGKNTTFKRCKIYTEYYSYYHIIEEETGYIETGNGGAIYMRVKDIPKELIVGNITFGENEEGNEGRLGYDLFILSYFAEELLTDEYFPFLKEKGEDYKGAVAYFYEDRKEYVLHETEGGKKDKGMKWWVILLIVLAVVIFIAGVVVGIVICCCCCKKNGSEDKEETYKEQAKNEELQNENENVQQQRNENYEENNQQVVQEQPYVQEQSNPPPLPPEQSYPPPLPPEQSYPPPLPPEQSNPPPLPPDVPSSKPPPLPTSKPPPMQTMLSTEEASAE